MPRKADKAEEKPTEGAAPLPLEPEDTLSIKELKVLDDKYLEMERECEKEIEKVQKLYSERQKPLLEERSKVLAEVPEGGDAASGTPAVSVFWLKAMKNHPGLEEMIEEWDMPVLEYLEDIVSEDLPVDEKCKAFKLIFRFKENPYFTNATLEKECHSEEDSPYTQEYSVTLVKGTEIDWKAGKDVTLAKVAKKAKGGGAKKAKQKTEKQEPRPSFFRELFRTLKPGDPLPDDLDPDIMEEEDEDGEVMDMLMERDGEIAHMLKEQVVPFAVRWYTGEATPDMGDDDDDEDDEEESEDPDEEEDDDDEPPPTKKKGGKKDAQGGTPGKEQQQECKQQ